MIALTRKFISRSQAQGFGEPIETWDNSDKSTFLSPDASIESLLDAANKRCATFSNEQRELLVSCLAKQYGSLPKPEQLNKNIQLLAKGNGVTITTGHQLTLGLGPLFLIYKALHVINACDRLNQVNSTCNFIPVFWLASEDHDFKEVQSTNFFKKTHTWESDQTGPVGQFNTTGLKEIHEVICSFFNSDELADIHHLFQVTETNYAAQIRLMLNTLFGAYGLVIIDGDDRELKRAFAPLMKRELTDQFIQKQVQKTNEELIARGMTIQAHVRPINLFYLSAGNRARIIANDYGYSADNLQWKKEELLEELDKYPERFSPNVLFRPIYQEHILPNVCYVGGGGEMAYWAQLKSAFNHVGVPFPSLQTRVSAFIVPTFADPKDIEPYFTPLQDQINHLLTKQSNRDELFAQIDETFEELTTQLKLGIQHFNRDASKWCGAQLTGISANLTHYKQRWQKEEKQLLDSQIKRLERIHQELYPNSIPQERYTNILHFCGKNGIHRWISALKNQIDPFSMEIHIFIQSNETE